MLLSKRQRKSISKKKACTRSLNVFSRSTFEHGPDRVSPNSMKTEWSYWNGRWMWYKSTRFGLRGLTLSLGIPKMQWKCFCRSWKILWWCQSEVVLTAARCVLTCVCFKRLLVLCTCMFTCVSWTCLLAWILHVYTRLVHARIGLMRDWKTPTKSHTRTRNGFHLWKTNSSCLWLQTVYQQTKRMVRTFLLSSVCSRA